MTANPGALLRACAAAAARLLAQPGAHAARSIGFGLLTAVLVLLSPSEAAASLLSPENEDKLANFLAVFVIFIVPMVLIVLFWMVHVMPEKIAHKRHHPQLEAIRTLCLLSLVFGGLLWPLAWLWAYTKPVGYKLAYGTDKVEHGHDAPTASAEAPGDAQELERMRRRVAELESKLAGQSASPGTKA